MHPPPPKPEINLILMCLNIFLAILNMLKDFEKFEENVSLAELIVFIDH